MSKLLVRPNRYTDECVVSYLTRVSHANGFNHLGHLLQYAGLRWKNFRAPTHQMTTGEYNIKPYFANLGLNYTVPRTANTFKSSQSRSFTTKIFVKTPRICPKCLESEGYCLDLWSYIAYTACIKHKVLLVDTNPTNGTKLSWYRKTLDRFSEDEPFPLDGTSLRASPDTLALSRTIARLIERRPVLKSAPALLRDLSFAEALSLIHFIAHYQYRLYHSSLFSPASLDTLTVSHHYTQAWKALNDWPRGFHMLLSQYIDCPMDQRGQSGINKHFRDIHEKLYRQRDNKGLAHLRAAFDQFIELSWPNAIQINRLTRISLSTDGRPLISQKEVQSILGCREPRIHCLITQRKITPHQFKGKTYFNRDEIESLHRVYQDNWSMEQAVNETELSRYQLKQLLDEGLVKVLQKADRHNRDWLICKTSWRCLVTSLKTSAQEHPVVQGKTLAGIQKQGFPVTVLLGLILKKQVEYNFTPNPRKPLSFKQISNLRVS